MKFIRVLKASLINDLKDDLNHILSIDDYEKQKVFFRNISKKFIRELRKLFRIEGLEKEQMSTSGIRGFHNLNHKGYSINVDYSLWPEHIVINSTAQGYIDKIKNILDQQDIKYNYRDGDIIIDLDKQF